MECGAMTESFDTAQDAAAAWNRRAQPDNKALTVDELRERTNEECLKNGWQLFDRPLDKED